MSRISAKRFQMGPVVRPPATTSVIYRILVPITSFSWIQDSAVDSAVAVAVAQPPPQESHAHGVF